MTSFSVGTRTGERVDPFATFKFHVEIGDVKEAAFMECSGLELSIDVFPYQEGGLNEFAHQLPGRTKMSNVTLKRGFAVSNELYKWFQEMEEGLLTGKGLTRKKVTITLYSAGEREIMRWTLNDAFPVRWVGPAFKSGEAGVAIESIEFTHHGIMLV